MTTIFDREKTCSVCGSKVSLHVIGSTNTFGGGPDLDTRPAEMMRSTMPHWVEVCPECGFASVDLEETTEITKAFLETDNYLSCDGIEFSDDLQRNFYREYLIKREDNDVEGCLLALLHCVWACDDKENGPASIIREKLIKGIEESGIIVENDAWELIKADLLRRTGQYARLTEEYAEKNYDKDMYNSIIKLQLELADKKDDAVHTMDEMDEYKEYTDE